MPRQVLCFFMILIQHPWIKSSRWPKSLTRSFSAFQESIKQVASCCSIAWSESSHVLYCFTKRGLNYHMSCIIFTETYLDCYVFSVILQRHIWIVTSSVLFNRDISGFSHVLCYFTETYLDFYMFYVILQRHIWIFTCSMLFYRDVSGFSHVLCYFIETYLDCHIFCIILQRHIWIVTSSVLFYRDISGLSHLLYYFTETYLDCHIFHVILQRHIWIVTWSKFHMTWIVTYPVLFYRDISGLSHVLCYFCRDIFELWHVLYNFTETDLNCHMSGQEYKDGETWQLDKCSACSCQRGITFCKRETCHNVTICPYMEIPEDGCCPVCRGKLINRNLC